MVLLYFLMVGRTAVMAQQTSQDVPGDDFSLEGALELFKKSASPEEFERKLNSPESKVNNLDLNGDREIDYIRVIDRNHGNVHAFILQAVLSSTESQDVAVIELEKLANGKAVLQITGDEDVYGIETIIEPTEEVRVNAGTSTARTIVNVWTWPSVQYVYSPYYTVWVSPWYWNHHPFWWYSWRPVTYYEYYSYWYPYRRYYSYCDMHRVAYARTIYRPYRRHSPVYYNRYETRIVSYRTSHRERHGNGHAYGHDRNGKRNDYDRDRSYSNDRTSRSTTGRKYDYKTTDRTPVVRERNDSRERTAVEVPKQREHKQAGDWKPDMKRSEPVFSNRTESRSKPQVERSSTPANRPEIQSGRSSKQFESKPVERSERSRSMNSEIRKSAGNGNGGGRGHGKKQ